MPNSTPIKPSLSSWAGYSLDKLKHQFIEPYLLDDLRTAQTREFDTFLKWLLGLKSDDHSGLIRLLQDVVPLCNQDDTLSLVAQYRNVTSETALYPPFCELMNHLLAPRNSGGQKHESTITFCVGDPQVVRPDPLHRSGTKPDVIVVSSSAPQVVRDPNRPLRRPRCGKYNAAAGRGQAHSNPVVGKPDGAQNEGKSVNTQARPSPDQPFYWTQVYSTVEFKKSKWDMASIPSRYSAQLETSPPATARAPDMSKIVDAYLKRLVASYGPTSISQSVTTSVTEQSTTSKKRKRADDQDDEAEDSPRTHDNVPPEIQSGNSAMVMLSTGRFRSFVFNFIVRNDVLWIQLCDRATVLISTGVNFVQDLPRLALLAHALRNLDDARWGANAMFRLDPAKNISSIFSYFPESTAAHPPDPILGVSLEIDNGVSVRLGSVLHQSMSLVGRGTHVQKILPQPDGPSFEADTEYTVKISHADKNRTPEALLIADARRTADAEGDRDILDHIPEVICHGTFTDTEDARNRTYFGAQYTNVVDRWLCAIVTPCLEPITNLETSEELAIVVRHILRCERSTLLYVISHTVGHHALWKQGHRHRDISPKNLMFSRKAEGLCGILNDHDLAIRVAGEHTHTPTSLHRTGTLPFLALDFLEKVPTVVDHLERHDWESACYSLIWICTRYSGKKDVAEAGHFTNHWLHHDFEHSRTKKKQMFREFPYDQIREEFIPFFIKWLLPATILFRKLLDVTEKYKDDLALSKWSLCPAPQPRDDDSFGDIITLEKLWPPVVDSTARSVPVSD